ncbi:MAG: hypothetical protein AB7I48_28135 [Planctomycetaceae bacterium]
MVTVAAPGSDGSFHRATTARFAGPKVPTGHLSPQSLPAAKPAQYDVRTTAALAYLFAGY